jgi:hypothetical protein
LDSAVSDAFGPPLANPNDVYRLKTLSNPSMPRLYGIPPQNSQTGTHASLSRISNNSASRANTAGSRDQRPQPLVHVSDQSAVDQQFLSPSNGPQQWTNYNPQGAVYAMDPFAYGVDENNGFAYAVPYYYPYQAVPMIPEHQAELVSEVPTEATTGAISSDPFMTKQEIEAITHPEVDDRLTQQVSIAIPDTEPLIK